MSSNAEPRVRIVECEHYDRETIRQLVYEGMGKLDFRPRGKVFVKPNVVFASDPEVFGEHAYTNPSLVGGALSALAQPTDVDRIDLGENCGIGFPTRFCFKMAGYYDVVDGVRSGARCPVGIYCIDEDRRDTVFVGGNVHDTLRLSRKMARADSKVYLPKLKCHCVSTMTGAVKLNIGICSDDERAIRHDFRLNEKIVDLLAVGWPDFIVMDAVEVGVGNEAFPTPRKLGLLLMGTNPIAIDLVGARLLGYNLEDVPYLKLAVERGYAPSSLEDVTLEGDVSTLDELDERAKRLLPYDWEYTAWQDIPANLDRLCSPMRFYFGPYGNNSDELCLTGCVMALKMFLATYERYAGPEAFAAAKAVVFVVGQVDEEIDARGEEVILIGSCAKANVRNAGKVTHIDKCFTTASDLTFAIGQRLGMPAPLADARLSLPLATNLVRASVRKLINRRYAQDIAHFVKSTLVRKI